MRRIIILLLIILQSCVMNKDVIITISTPYGDMKAILYEETPLHKKNFIELSESGKFDSTIFHRVIKDFMIQGGDINLINEEEVIDYTIPAEVNNKLFHKKGEIAAARMGDDVNPNKESSGCQFYIVDGKVYTWHLAYNTPKDSRFDPEVSSYGVGSNVRGFDSMTGPTAKKYGATLSLTF